MAAPFYAAMMDFLVPHRPGITLPELMVMNTELYRKHGSSLHGWMHELGEDMAFTLRMFKQFAPHLRDGVLPHMQRNEVLLARLAALQAQGHELVILTLGHRDYCLPILEKVGIAEYIPAEKVFDISVMEGRLKRDASTYDYLLQHHVKGEWRHKYMFEDSMANLIAAHKAGFETILVGPQKVPEELQEAIDRQFGTVVEGIDAVLGDMPV